jgi:hypothetical protein
MRHIKHIINIATCLLLLGFGGPVSGAIKKTVPNVEALWHHYLAGDARKSPTISFPYEHCFASAAQKFDLPLSLLLAVARGESNFNPQAKSDRNCHGLMQIQWPGTAKHLGINRLEALYEPCTNIRAGARYLRELLDRYDQNLHLALAAYNYGPTRISKTNAAGSIPQGAQWYSGYIYHHLKTIMQGATAAGGLSNSGDRNAFSRQKQLAIITFNRPYRANAFYRHVQKQAPSLQLDWYRIGMGRYQVVMLYSDQQTLVNGKKKLKNLGITVKGQ